MVYTASPFITILVVYLYESVHDLLGAMCLREIQREYATLCGVPKQEVHSASCVYIFCLQTFKASGLVCGEFPWKFFWFHLFMSSSVGGKWNRPHLFYHGSLYKISWFLCIFLPFLLWGSGENEGNLTPKAFASSAVGCSFLMFIKPYNFLEIKTSVCSFTLQLCYVTESLKEEEF